MSWELSSLIETVRNEYRGWRDFEQAAGKWPVCSILAGIVSIPACFASGMYLFIKTLETSREWVIYPALFAIAICAAAGWYGLRRLACKVDVGRAKKAGATQVSSETLEAFIR